MDHSVAQVRPKMMQRSAPVSLPKSHIRRTQSELAMEELTLRAEYHDASMYARLVTGMSGQLARHQDLPSGGYAQTAKSLEGIVKTKMRRELDSDEEDTETNGWCMSFAIVDDESSHTMSSDNASTESLTSLDEDTGDDEDRDEDCTFIMDDL